MSGTKVETFKAAGRTALLVMDMVNDLAFEGGDAMVEPGLVAARRIQPLAAAARRARVPVVYVNDNFGQWHSERRKLIQHAVRQGAPGREMVKLIAPRPGDFFVIKPMHSGFYATNLPVLLPKLKVDRVIVTGIAADMCVMLTAADAHMRAYDIWTPSDCIAATSPERVHWALEIMATAFGAVTQPTSDLTLRAWLAAAKGGNSLGAK